MITLSHTFDYKTKQRTIFWIHRVPILAILFLINFHRKRHIRNFINQTSEIQKLAGISLKPVIF